MVAEQGSHSVNYRIQSGYNSGLLLWFSCRRSEEHTSELQSLAYLVCRLLLEKKKKPLRDSVCSSTLVFVGGILPPYYWPAGASRRWAGVACDPVADGARRPFVPSAASYVGAD